MSSRQFVGFFVPTMALSIAGWSDTSQAQWPQFGGPDRNFMAPRTQGLATDWPTGGPKKLWTRVLGDAYSGISVDDGKLYTMYHDGRNEIVVCLDAKSGATIWEHKHLVSKFADLDEGFGMGARSSPLIDGDMVYATGVSGMVYALAKKSGEAAWTHDLMNDHGATPMRWGYSCSPLAYKDTIIVSSGGKGKSIMAFDKTSGSVAWARHDARNGYSSPIQISVDGQAQIVVFMAEGVMGLNPDNGDLYWTYAHPTDYDVNASTPVWGSDNILFISSAYGAGSRGLQLKREGEKTTVTQLWHQKKMQIHFGGGIRIGDYVYGSSGGNGPTFFAAINVKTGEMGFRERDVASKAQLLFADGKMLLLDEDGHLVIATVTPEAAKVHAKAQVLERIAWTAPAIAGKTLFVRDRKNIVALDLG
jgi:outer membrane protein assembly factor BamB